VEEARYQLIVDERDPNTVTVVDRVGERLPNGHRRHAKGCSRRLKTRWSGMRCDCGARWQCY